MYEAGLDPDNLVKQPKVIVHGLMIFQVLYKRHLELDDLANGRLIQVQFNYEHVILHTFKVHVIYSHPYRITEISLVCKYG